MAAVEPTEPVVPLEVVDLGTMAYAAALAEQHAAHAAVLAGGPPRVLLVEHTPVITVSQRRAAASHLVADAATLARLGIEVQPTDRGGDITYHGPGQLVAYPILKLNAFGLSLGGYMRLLEQAIIDTAVAWGVEGQRAEGMTGVWVEGGGSRVAGLGSCASTAPAGSARPSTPDPRPPALARPIAKLAALGVRVRRNVTLHGLALNVTTDLSHFATIVPCGLVGRPVTSLAQLLGDRCPSMAAVKAELVRQLQRQLAATR